MTVRAVIDTNIWVSAIINPFGFPAQLRKAFESGAFLAIVSEPLLEELAEVLNRPRIKAKYGLTEDTIAALLVLIDERSEHVMLEDDIHICRDKDDDHVIETAVKGNASYMVSRDDDIKFDSAVSSFLDDYGIGVKTVAQFLEIITS